MDIDKVKQETKTPTFDKQSFEKYLDSKDHRPRTIQHYLFYWDKWIKYNTTHNAKLGQQELRDFLSEHKDNTVARAFINNLTDWIRTYNFPQEMKDTLRDFKLTRKTGSKDKKQGEFRTLEQIHLISNHMKDDRGQLMILTGFYLGLRVSELCNITTKDINWTNETITVMEWAKRGKERQMKILNILHNPLLQYINKYIGDKAFDISQPPIKIFNISVRKFHKMITEASIKAIGEKTSPHTLRRSCGTWLKTKGKDIEFIKKYLDHNSIETTQRYIDSDKTQYNKEVEQLNQ